MTFNFPYGKDFIFWRKFKYTWGNTSACFNNKVYEKNLSLRWFKNKLKFFER